LVSVLWRSERARKGGDSDDVGCAEEKDHASQEEDRKAEENVAELARQKIAAEKVAAKTVATAEAQQVRLRRSWPRKPPRRRSLHLAPLLMRSWQRRPLHLVPPPMRSRRRRPLQLGRSLAKQARENRMRPQRRWWKKLQLAPGRKGLKR
jgi:hypothetical protein